jgi:UDP-N-acetylmuramoyl-tripeptide--D-alanyl-D-alanine ligase
MNNRELTLADLLLGIAGMHPPGMDVPVQPVIDSRQATEGVVFFAFKGERVDGHDYVQDALEKGAVAAVVEREVTTGLPCLDLTQEFIPTRSISPPVIIRVPDVMQAMQKAAAYWRQVIGPRVIGITGSVGKTTTKEVVAAVLEQRYSVLRSVGSHNNEIGLPLTILSLDSSIDYLVVEMGMYVRGDIRSLSQIARPDVGIVTNVEPVHAERAGSLEEIALSKRELVEDLPKAPQGVAILNFDDRRVREMQTFTPARVFSYGLSPEADLWADDIESFGLDGIRLRLHYQGGIIKAKIPLLGRHSAHTVLRAAAAGLVEGLTWQEIIEGLRMPGSQLRLVTVRGPDDALILDDTYNSSPPSALAALNLLCELPGRKVAVVGDMLELGDYEEDGHLRVGCRTAAVVSELIAVGSLGKMIARGASLCGLAKDRIHYAIDSDNAVDVLLGILQPKDVVLVKGSRGMKMETIVTAVTKEPM